MYGTLKGKMENRVRRIINGELVGPHTLEVYPTGACNLHCLYCDIPSRPKAKELSPIKFYRLVKDACENGVKEVRILGDGEPFARRSLTLSLMELAKKYGARGTVITNGTILREEDLRRIVEMEWDDLAISLDSHDEITQDEICGREGAFVRIVNTINTLNKIKKETGKDKPRLVLNTVISRLNFRHLLKLVEFSAKNKIAAIFFDSLVVYRDWMRRLALDETEKERFLEIAKETKEILKKHNIETNISSFMSKDSVSRSQEDKKEVENDCFSAHHTMIITPTGGVKPCCNFPGEVDSVRKKRLMAVWHGQAFKELRDSKKFPCNSFCSSPFQERNKEIKAKLNKNPGGVPNK